jgi:signal transduction histidine kinase
VGATLGSINILSKTATRKLEKQPEPAEIHSIFQKIGSSAENTLEAMDDIVWSINPDKDKLQDLVIRMREYAIPLLEAKNIEFNFKTEGDLSQTISMNLRRNLFLIFKESIHNILKHSDASYISIFLGIKNQAIHFNIADNGKGFDPKSSTSRNGVKNMQQRAQAIGAVLKIRSSENGTEINFDSPVR